MNENFFPPMPRWTLLSHHGMALLCIARDPEIRLRELALRVGITDRTAHSIVDDLVEAGYLSRLRVGRRNSYRVHAEKGLRHPEVEAHRVCELLEPLVVGS